MSDHGFALFQTRIGVCAIAWKNDGEAEEITRVMLPDLSAEKVRRSMLDANRCAEERRPQDNIQRIIDRIRRLCNGQAAQFDDVAIAQDEFSASQKKIYRIVRQIGFGSTMTYGEVAIAADMPGSAQAVGRAMAVNPAPVIIPCHRIIGAEGKMVGFSATGGVKAKKRLLEIEGAFALNKLPLFGGTDQR